PGTFAPIETTPSGTPLSHGVTYYVRLVAKDADGKAPVGAQASGTISKVTGDDSDLTADDVGAATEDYIKSRGTDLVANGTGYLGNNTNFSNFNVDPTDTPPGATVSFVPKSQAYSF